ncbi:MAG: alpha/beta fold hydrolase [Gammaproteobacteria bacterium]
MARKRASIRGTPQWFVDAISQPRQEHYVPVENGNICYQFWKGPADNPSAPLVLLIHGSGAHRHWWDFIGGILCKNVNVLALDLPGMGDSDFYPEYNQQLFSDALYAATQDALQRYCDSSQKPAIYLVGHSMGGSLALNATLHYPDMAQGLMIVDTPIRPPDYDYSSHQGSGPIRKIQLYPGRDQILSRFRIVPSQPPIAQYIHEYIARYSIRFISKDKGWRWKYDDSIFSSMGKDFTQRHRVLSQPFSCPICLIYGTESMLMPEEVVTYMRAQLAQSDQETEVVPLWGLHHHLLLEEPQDFAELIVQKVDRWHANIKP